MSPPRCRAAPHRRSRCRRRRSRHTSARRRARWRAARGSARQALLRGTATGETSSPPRRAVTRAPNRAVPRRGRFGQRPRSRSSTTYRTPVAASATFAALLLDGSRPGLGHPAFHGRQATCARRVPAMWIEGHYDASADIAWLRLETYDAAKVVAEE